MDLLAGAAKGVWERAIPDRRRGWTGGHSGIPNIHCSIGVCRPSAEEKAEASGAAATGGAAGRSSEIEAARSEATVEAIVADSGLRCRTCPLGADRNWVPGTSFSDDAGWSANAEGWAIPNCRAAESFLTPWAGWVLLTYLTGSRLAWHRGLPEATGAAELGLGSRAEGAACRGPEGEPGDGEEEEEGDGETKDEFKEEFWGRDDIDK